jgi:hypothetical protein
VNDVDDAAIEADEAETYRRAAAAVREAAAGAEGLEAAAALTEQAAHDAAALIGDLSRTLRGMLGEPVNRAQRRAVQRQARKPGRPRRTR